MTLTRERVRRVLRKYLSAGMAEQALDQLYPKRKQLTMKERHERALARERERKAG